VPDTVTVLAHRGQTQADAKQASQQRIQEHALGAVDAQQTRTGGQTGAGGRAGGRCRTDQDNAQHQQQQQRAQEMAEVGRTRCHGLAAFDTGLNVKEFAELNVRDCIVFADSGKAFGRTCFKYETDTPPVTLALPSNHVWTI